MERVLFLHIAELVTPIGREAHRGSRMNEVQRIRDAAMLVEDGVIRRVDTSAILLAECLTRMDGVQVVDLTGHAVIPGFVDSHTHFVFGGYRPDEFMLRLQGAPYIEIHKMGGGIASTVKATRSADKETLKESGRERLADMLSMGVTTVEGKSGYGLDHDCELTQLEVMKELDEEQPVDIVRTFLGAHSIPEEYAADPDAYIMFLIHEMLPTIKDRQLAEFVDIFCEDGVFSAAQSETLLSAAMRQGFGAKIHADEIVSTGGAELAARIGAASADHLLMISEEGINDLAEGQTVATLLPCTAFCLNKPYAPARKIIDAGCAVALASDYNPGSCYTNSIPLMLGLAVIHMGMTLNEALTALTLNGAAALRRADRIGSLEPGKRADFSVLRTPQVEFLVYHTCKNQVEQVYKGGRRVY